MTDKAQIILPEGAKGDLVELTRQIVLKTGKETAFGLGGKYGYGVEYENEVFMLHPYCWCDQDDCPWCGEDAPNFLYKPTGYKLWWYKYIGRDERSEGELPKNWFKKCVESIWEKDDCWYEFDVGCRSVEEGLQGRKETPKVTLCFNVSDPKAIVTAELSPMAEESVGYWGIETIIADMANAKLEETKEYKKALRLNEKYPALGRKIAQDAIERHKEQIEWHKNWIKELGGAI